MSSLPCTEFRCSPNSLRLDDASGCAGFIRRQFAGCHRFCDCSWSASPPAIAEDITTDMTSDRTLDHGHQIG